MKWLQLRMVCTILCVVWRVERGLTWMTLVPRRRWWSISLTIESGGTEELRVTMMCVWWLLRRVMRYSELVGRDWMLSRTTSTGWETVAGRAWGRGRQQAYDGM